MMMFAAGTLHRKLLLERFCRQDLYGHLSSKMQNFGAKHVMHVNEQVQDDSSMALNSLSHLLGHLRNGVSMQLDPCQEQLQEGSTL